MPIASASTTRPAPRRRSSAVAPGDKDGLSDKALEIHRRLCRSFGCPIAYFHDLDPLSELVASLLSHRTRNAESGRAFEALRARWPSWEGLLEAAPGEIEATIRGVTWPELKGPRILAVLRAIRDKQGSLHLDGLAGMGVDAARAWLEAIPGVGPKTSAAVLSFSTLRMPALPVDSHHHRVAQRTGLIGDRVDVGPAHAILRAQLPADWSAQALYDNHEVLMLHGQQVCHFRNPACGSCVLLDLCPSGRKRVPMEP